MTAQQIKDCKGKYLYDTYDGELIHIDRVEIDDVWVDAWGTVMCTNGEVKTDKWFDLGSLDSVLTREGRASGRLVKDEYGYKMDEKFRILEVREAREMLEERLGDIRRKFGF